MSKTFKEEFEAFEAKWGAIIRNADHRALADLQAIKEKFASAPAPAPAPPAPAK